MRAPTPTAPEMAPQMLPVQHCTPGQICSVVAMLAESRAGMPSHVTADLTATPAGLSDDEIRERMSGNLCRCSAYPNIVAAFREVAGARA